MTPVEDGTTRFLEILEAIRNGEHTLPNSFVYLLIPGLFSNHGPLYFVGTKRFFSKMALTCHIAKIHGEHNAWELKQYIEELYWGSEPIWRNPCSFLREGQIADKETRRIMELIICKIIKGDIRALEDLTYEKKKEFILKHKLSEQIPIISFHSEAQIAPGVLVTMSHISHAELPWLPILKFCSDDSDNSNIVLSRGGNFPIVIPLSAAMAVCALHLRLRYGEKSDGVVACRDAEVPGSVVVRPGRKLDHAWMVYSSARKDTVDLDGTDMCEAILTMLVDLGKKQVN
ncbi:hypothetical protein MLD38_014332 [Melastoma candidum]|uniref:Uncharacterized protein n=1 Tax=Melastoma candidum TaxID=119954 RepID=A0ACB9REB8_9MYRT|nr:hypothetical protein MLD38_014332 [Melastoma candidum]